MSAPTSPLKRPRLSLQIKAISNGQSGRTSRTLAATVDPKSPTAFNTLSNVYVTAIDRSATAQPDPITAIHMTPKPRLHLQTEVGVAKERQLSTPYVGAFPETPLTAQPLSPAVAMEINFPNAMTATPPLSAGPVDSASFGFTPSDAVVYPSATTPIAADRTPRRRTTFPQTFTNTRPAPYNHPRALHSILRNSPLPPSSAKTPVSPRRQSLRLQEKAARRVGYNSPLTQTITTNWYTRSHIDLLCDDLSPFSPPSAQEDAVVTPVSAYESYETRDGGQTPGPFEEMRRRLAGLGTTTPVSPASGGVRKRKKKDKKRRWVWTLGQDEEEDGAGAGLVPTKAAQMAAAIRDVPTTSATAAAVTTAVASVETATIANYQSVMIEPPTPSIESNTEQDSIFEGFLDDVAMSEDTSIISDLAGGRGSSPMDMEMDLETPIATRKPSSREMGSRDRLGSVDLFNPDTGSRRDTPVPDLITE